jgi:hypothetical protein
MRVISVHHDVVFTQDAQVVESRRFLDEAAVDVVPGHLPDIESGKVCRATQLCSPAQEIECCPTRPVSLPFNHLGWGRFNGLGCDSLRTRSWGSPLKPGEPNIWASGPLVVNRQPAC